MFLSQASYKSDFIHMVKNVCWDLEIKHIHTSYMYFTMPMEICEDENENPTEEEKIRDIERCTDPS